MLWPLNPYWAVGFTKIVGALLGIVIADGVGISNEGGNKLGTPKAFNCGALIPKSGISIFTVFGLIDASTFISTIGSWAGSLLASPYDDKGRFFLSFDEAERLFAPKGNSP